MTLSERTALKVAADALYAIACKNEPNERDDMIDLAYEAISAVYRLVPELEEQE